MSEAQEEEVQERDYESEARKEGWAPQEDWKGPADRWKSAEQFVKDGENITPILRSKVERLEARVNEVLQTNKQLNEFSKRSLEKEKKENKRLIAELEEARKQAVTDGDGDAFARADSQIQTLKEEDKPQTQALDPLAQQWVNDNPWYVTDDKLGAFADGISERIDQRGFTGQARFDEITRQVKEAFPQEFENKSRAKPSSVESGGSKTVKGSDSHTFSDLPKEAKDAYQMFKRDTPGFTKEQYLEQYDWSEENV